jgi:hypothetical protein
VVFILPAPPRPIALAHRRLVFDMLVAAASDTLLTVGRDPARLGAQLAVTAVLHTWKRYLGSAGASTSPLTGGFRPPTTTSFPSSSSARSFAGRCSPLSGPRSTAATSRFPTPKRIELFETLRRTKWVVYAKRTFGDAEQVIRYLGRYTHRVGISNARLQDVSPAAVTEGYKRVAGGKTLVVMGCPARAR